MIALMKMLPIQDVYRNMFIFEIQIYESFGTLRLGEKDELKVLFAFRSLFSICDAFIFFHNYLVLI